MNYVPLQIATILPEKELTFDLYIHFKDQYLQYASSGTSISGEKLDKLQVQQIAKFYIPASQEPNYEAFLDAIINEAVGSDETPLENKLDLIEGAAATGIEGMEQESSSVASYKITQKAAKGLREIIGNNPNALKKIYGKVSNELTDLIRHNYNVCALSTKLGEQLGLTDEELDDLGTAALLHDLGITRLQGDDKLLFMKPKKNFTPADYRIYKFHVEDSVKLLADKPYVNENVIELVRNHEENMGGTGPQKKKKLTKSEEILSLVNNYDKRVISQKVHAKQAAKELQIEEVGNYQLKTIQALIKVLQAEGLFET